jgi:hypothetical protein
MLQVGTSLATGHGFAVPCASGMAGRAGHCFSTYYPLQSVLAVPLILGGRALAAVIPASPGYLGQFAAQVLPALAAAGVAGFTVYFTQLLGASRRRSILSGLTVILATEIAVYDRTFFAETLAAFLVCLLVWGFVRHDRWRVLAPVAIVALILTKPQLFLVGLVVGAILAGSERRRRPAVEAGIATLIGVLLYAGYNYLRFADVTDFGGAARTYHAASLTPWKLFDATGLLLVSPGRGWLVYSPIVILGLYGAWRMRDHRLAAVAFGVLAATLIPYLGNPGGGFEWGSRYLVPAIPLFVAFAWAVPARRWAAPALAILGLVIVAPTFAAFYQRSYAEGVARGEMPSDVYWSVRRAPLVKMWGAAGRQITVARRSDVRRLVQEPNQLPTTADAVSEQKFFRVVAEWWWMTPAAMLPRSLGLLGALIVLGSGVAILGRGRWPPELPQRAERPDDLWARRPAVDVD